MPTFNKKVWSLRIAKLIELYYLRILKIQTHSISDKDTLEVLFLGIIEKTNDPKRWVVKKIFYSAYTTEISVGTELVANFGLPTNASLNA